MDIVFIGVPVVMIAAASFLSWLCSRDWSEGVAHNLIGIHIEISQDLANGKTLDQLCTEYGIPTTKEVS